MTPESLKVLPTVRSTPENWILWSTTPSPLRLTKSALFRSEAARLAPVCS